jgi:hypothetical protein
MARPTLFNDALAEEICRRLAMGRPLAKICADDEMPAYSTVRKWEAENPAFSALSARAKVDGTHYMADECLEIADGKGDPADKRIRIDTRLRLIGKWNRHVYGDKLAHVGGGKDDAPIRQSHAFDLGGATDEELDVLERFIGRTAHAGRDQGGESETQG